VGAQLTACALHGAGAASATTRGHRGHRHHEPAQLALRRHVARVQRPSVLCEKDHLIHVLTPTTSAWTVAGRRIHPKGAPTLQATIARSVSVFVLIGSKISIMVCAALVVRRAPPIPAAIAN